MHAKQVLWTKFGVNSSRHTDKQTDMWLKLAAWKRIRYILTVHTGWALNILCINLDYALNSLTFLRFRCKSLPSHLVDGFLFVATLLENLHIQCDTTTSQWESRRWQIFHKVVQQHVQGVAGRLLMTFVTNSLLATVKKFFKRSAFAPTSSDSQWLFLCHPVTVWLNKQPKVNMSWLSYTRKWSPQPVLPGNTYLEVTQGSYHRQRLTAMRSSHSIYCNK